MSVQNFDYSLYQCFYKIQLKTTNNDSVLLKELGQYDLLAYSYYGNTLCGKGEYSKIEKAFFIVVQLNDGLSTRTAKYPIQDTSGFLKPEEKSVRFVLREKMLFEQLSLEGAVPFVESFAYFDVELALSKGVRVKTPKVMYRLPRPDKAVYLDDKDISVYYPGYSPPSAVPDTGSDRDSETLQKRKDENDTD